MRASYLYTRKNLYTYTKSYISVEIIQGQSTNTHACPSINICIFKIHTDAHTYTPIQVHTYLWKSSRARKHEYTSAARAFPDKTICRCFPESE